MAEVYGTVANDLFGAFAEFEAVSRGTKAREYLYSVSISPPSALTREQYFEAIAAIEKRLGLTGQPRAVVFHVKSDVRGISREHCHVVWSRIDIEKMRAIHMGHDRRRLMDLACELARKYDLDLPPGLKAWERSRSSRRKSSNPRWPSGGGSRRPASRRSSVVTKSPLPTKPRTAPRLSATRLRKRAMCSRGASGAASWW